MEENNNLNNTFGEESGYTVNPEGNFYRVAKEEIIQDSVPETETVRRVIEPVKAEKPKTPKREGKARKKPNNLLTVLMASVLALVIGALSGGAVAGYILKKGENIYNNGSNTPINNVNINIDKNAENIVEAVATKVTPSVVGIRTTTSVNSFFYGTQEASGEGSGVVYTSDGYIITNYHVIADGITKKAASKIEVFIDSNAEKAYNATVVGYNIAADLAVIKIDASGLAPIEFADSEELKVGQYVITVGNPGGLEFMDSITYGVVSGLNRVVSTNGDIELIQTDAAINPGNSGGALVNVKGQLVGINSSKIVSEEFEGMGFAIPSNTTKEICDNIIERENYPEAYVGITISERYTSAVLKTYGFPAGAVVSRVAEGSPANEAGIERGDIITEFGDKTIKEYTDLEDSVRNSTPGDTVKVKIYRNGRYYTTDLTIGANN